MSTPAEKRDEIRKCIQRYFAARSEAKMRASAATAHVADEGHRVDEAHMERELDFLTRGGWLEKTFPPSGSTPRYQATPQLVLAFERGGL